MNTSQSYLDLFLRLQHTPGPADAQPRPNDEITLDLRASISERCATASMVVCQAGQTLLNISVEPGLPDGDITMLDNDLAVIGTSSSSSSFVGNADLDMDITVDHPVISHWPIVSISDSDVIPATMQVDGGPVEDLRLDVAKLGLGDDDIPLDEPSIRTITSIPSPTPFTPTNRSQTIGLFDNLELPFDDSNFTYLQGALLTAATPSLLTEEFVQRLGEIGRKLKSKPSEKERKGSPLFKTPRRNGNNTAPRRKKPKRSPTSDIDSPLPYTNQTLSLFDLETPSKPSLSPKTPRRRTPPPRLIHPYKQQSIVDLDVDDLSPTISWRTRRGVRSTNSDLIAEELWPLSVNRRRRRRGVSQSSDHSDSIILADLSSFSCLESPSPSPPSVTATFLSEALPCTQPDPLTPKVVDTFTCPSVTPCSLSDNDVDEDVVVVHSTPYSSTTTLVDTPASQEEPPKLSRPIEPGVEIVQLPEEEEEESDDGDPVFPGAYPYPFPETKHLVSSLMSKLNPRRRSSKSLFGWTVELVFGW